jgi:isopenicillin-N N-acyltransferase-like protein
MTVSFRATGVILLSLLSLGQSAYCGGHPDPNAQPNEYPIATSSPVFNRSVANGHAYTAGASGFEFNVVHLYGSAYEMGYAHGALFPNETREMLNRTWAYMVSQIDSGLASLPAWLAELVGDVVLEVALDVLIDLTTPSTGAYIYEELRGLADGAQLDYKRLARVHLIGELTQGDCSLIGAWGRATAGGKTLQLRALDWDTDGPFRDFPAVFVYHPTTPGAHAFVNVGLLGFIGCFTGQSAAQLGVSEIGVSYPDTTYFGSETFAGVPFVYLLRDVLEFDAREADAVARITGANRTCDLILGVGDGKPAAPGGAGTARSFAYSAGDIFVFNDTNLQPWNDTADTWHPRFPDLVWHAMDWLCPGYSVPMAAQIKGLWGALTPANIIQDVLGRVQTGDVHAAVYDLTDQQIYVSFMARHNQTDGLPEMAYARAFTQLDLNKLFELPPPAV